MLRQLLDEHADERHQRRHWPHAVRGADAQERLVTVTLEMPSQKCGRSRSGRLAPRGARLKNAARQHSEPLAPVVQVPPGSCRFAIGGVGGREIEIRRVLEAVKVAVAGKRSVGFG
jgi:hypothetical protein